MADDLLDNDSVQNVATVGAAGGALAFAATGLMDTNILVDTAGLAGTQLDAGYGAFAAAGAVKAWNVIGKYTDN